MHLQGKDESHMCNYGNAKCERGFVWGHAG